MEQIGRTDPITLYVTDKDTCIINYSYRGAYGYTPANSITGDFVYTLNNRQNKTRKGYRILEIKESKYFALMI